MQTARTSERKPNRATAIFQHNYPKIGYLAIARVFELKAERIYS